METILALIALPLVAAVVGTPSVLLLLLVAAFVTTILSAIGKCPVWVPVMLLVVAVLVFAIPIR